MVHQGCQKRGDGAVVHANFRSNKGGAFTVCPISSVRDTGGLLRNMDTEDWPSLVS